MFVEKIPLPQVAFCLGQGDPLEARLLQQGLLKHTAPGLWEVLTREAQAQGEVARDGDFIKLDSIGMPYPVEAAFFLPRHTRQPDGRYLQTPRVLQAWRQEEPMGHEMRYLLETGLLQHHPETPEAAFRAFLYGTWQTVAADAVIIFDSIETSPRGTIEEIEFHFIARDEFEKTYRILPENTPV